MNRFKRYSVHGIPIERGHSFQPWVHMPSDPSHVLLNCQEFDSDQ